MVLLEELPSEGEAPSIQLGFAVPSTPSNNNKILANHEEQFDDDEFPSKIGGKPVWLNPSCVPKASDVHCGVCDSPLNLLMQIYTPEDEPAEAYHRVIYVFCCRNGKCHKENWREWCVFARGGDVEREDPRIAANRCNAFSFVALRQQLPKDNPYFPASQQRDCSAQCKPLCRVCGLAGPYKCSVCKTASAEDAKLDELRVVDEKLLLATLFPEMDLVSEPEPDTLAAKAEMLSELKQMMTKLRLNTPSDSKAVQKVNLRELEEEYDKSAVDVDEAFLKFQKRISRAPDQVLRYVRVLYEHESSQNGENEDLMPLWTAQEGQPQKEDIPPCEHCGAERTFEFQIMPQLLNHLSLDHSDPNSIDFGTIIVYSCSKNCQPCDTSGVPKGYMLESVWRQMFSDTGLQDKLKRTNDPLDESDKEE